MKILVSAGETSGDRYAAGLTAELKKLLPAAEFFGSAGPCLRAEGVRAIIRSEDLAVVGLFEVAAHIPRIYRKFRQLTASARLERPGLAILVDAPDFHFRLAAKLRAQGVPVVYYVAPQLWAWRQWRVRKFRRLVDLLLCIFPFEEQFFRERGVETQFTGHPLADAPGPDLSREEFFARHELDPAAPLLALLPGSRRGEAARHMPALLDAVRRLERDRPLNAVLAASHATGGGFFRQRFACGNVRIVENSTRNALGHADAALVASGTAAVGAALLGTPMAVFYRVTRPTWLLGKMLVKTPYYSMVNLLAGRAIVPELIQSECNGAALAREAAALLDDEERRNRMKRDLSEIRAALERPVPAARAAAEAICSRFRLNAR